MDKASEISRVVAAFLEDKRTSFVPRPPGVTDAAMEAVGDSLQILLKQVEGCQYQFKDMDGAYKETVTKLFEQQRLNIQNIKDMRTDFVELMFDGIKSSFEKGNTAKGMDTAFGYGPAAYVYVVIVISILYAAQKAATQGGVDNRPVLDATASFLATLKFRPFAEHAGRLSESIANDLPAKLEKFGEASA